MIREWSCDAPRSWPNANRSSPSTPSPARFAAQYAAPDPSPPSPTIATAKSRRSATSDLGLGVLVVLVRRHGLARRRAPLALRGRDLAERLRHSPHVGLDRSAARADVLDPGRRRLRRK